MDAQDEVFQELTKEKAPEFFCDNCGLTRLNRSMGTSFAPPARCQLNVAKGCRQMTKLIVGKRADRVADSFRTRRDEKNRQVCLIRQSRNCCEGMPLESNYD